MTTPVIRPDSAGCSGRVSSEKVARQMECGGPSLRREKRGKRGVVTCKALYGFLSIIFEKFLWGGPVFRRLHVWYFLTVRGVCTLHILYYLYALSPASLQEVPTGNLHNLYYLFLKILRVLACKHKRTPPAARPGGLPRNKP